MALCQHLCVQRFCRSWEATGGLLAFGRLCNSTVCCAPAAVREPLDGEGPGPAIGAFMRRHCVLRSCALFSHARQVRAVRSMLHLLAGGLNTFSMQHGCSLMHYNDLALHA